MIKKIVVTAIFLFFAQNLVSAQLESGGNPGAVNRNFSNQVRQLEIDKEYVETVPEDLDKQKKLKEEQDKLFKDVPKGGVIYNPKFKLKDLNFEGNTIYSDKKLKSIGGKKIIGEEIYLEDVLDYAVTISRYYQKNGYLTTYAYIPQQEIKEGVLTIVISESKVEEKKITGNFWARKFYIEKIATGGTHLSIGKVFNIKQLQGAVKKINKEPYMSTTVGIEKNQNEGTVIELEMKDRIPLSLDFGWDNFGRDLIGRQRFSALLGSDNLTGFGDKIYGGPILSDRSQSVVAGYQIPISPYGTSIGFDYSFSKVNPGGEFADLGLEGRSSFYTLRLNQVLINNMTTDLAAYAKFDWIYSRTDLTTIEEKIADYTLRVPRVGLNLMHDDSRGRWLANVEASFGIDGMGASPNIDGGPQSGFQKYTASIARVERLPWDMLGIVRVNGQYSPQALFAAEQMYIGGPYSIWGYQPSELLGDWGVAGGVELRFPIPFLKQTLPEKYKHISDRFKLVAFYNWGFVKTQTEVNDNPKDFLQSVGFGSYISLTELLNIQIGVGFPIGERFGDQTAARMYFTINTELDRLMKPKSHVAKVKQKTKTGQIKEKIIPVSRVSCFSNEPIKPLK